MDKRNAIAAVLLLCMLLSGCWDRIELQERGFVLGVAIDLEPQEEEEEEQQSSSPQLTGTFQIINPSVIRQSGGGSGGGTGRPYTNLSASGSSISSVTALASAMIGREPFFEHLRLLIISGEAARHQDAFSNALDFFLRNPEMRRDVIVLVARSRASDILDVPPINEHFPVTYIENILDNYRKNTYLLPHKRLGDLHEDLLNDYSYAIQLVERGNAGVALTGAAVFDGTDNTLQGFLDRTETQGLNFLMGAIKGGILQATYEGRPIDLSIDRMAKQMSADVSDPSKPVFRVRIKLEGSLNQSIPKFEADSSNLSLLQTRFEEEIIRLCRKTLEKLQQEMKLDPAGFGRHVMRRHYRLWQREYEGKWDKLVFPNADIRVEASVVIRRIGSIDESERS